MRAPVKRPNGSAPLDLKIRETSDAGTRITVSEPDNPHALVYRGIAARIWKKVAGADVASPRIVIE
jgi:ATP-binding protein involved in chromosome partitioning